MSIESDGNQSNEASTLDIMLKNAPPSAYGPPLEEAVAKIFHGILAQNLDKKSWDQLKEQHKIPSNCKLLGAPRVNSELWSNFDKILISKDWELRTLQDTISMIMISLAKTVQYVNGNSASFKDDSAKQIMTFLSDAATATAHAFQDLSNKRRAQIKKTLPKDVAAAVYNSDIQSQCSELLFGDNLAERLKTARSTVNLTRQFRGRGNNRMMPYRGRGRGRGGSHYGSGGTTDNLNFRGPPHHNRGFRGGRARGNHFSNQQTHQDHHHQ